MEELRSFLVLLLLSSSLLVSSQINEEGSGAEEGSAEEAAALPSEAPLTWPKAEERTDGPLVAAAVILVAVAVVLLVVGRRLSSTRSHGVEWWQRGTRVRTRDLDL